jgi:hypothetical protein
MNIKLYSAAHANLKAKAMESLALISVLLENPRVVPDHTNLVEEIAVHCRQLAEHEGAMLTLQQYFGPSQPAPAAPAPAPAQPPSPPGPPITEEDLMRRSPTYRKGSPRKKKAAEKAPKEAKKKDD